MKSKSYILYFILIAIIIFLIFNRNRLLDREVVTTITRDTIVLPGDEHFTEITNTVKVPVTKYIYLQEPASEIDTVAIVKDYFLKRGYCDTISGQEVYVIINEQLWQNKIENRDVFIKNNRSSSIITERIETTLSEKPHNKLFMGGGTSLSSDKIGFNLGLIFLNKRENIFGLSYDPINMQLNFNAYIKLRLKHGSKKTTKE